MTGRRSGALKYCAQIPHIASNRNPGALTATKHHHLITAPAVPFSSSSLFPKVIWSNPNANSSLTSNSNSSIVQNSSRNYCAIVDRNQSFYYSKGRGRHGNATHNHATITTGKFYKNENSSMLASHAEKKKDKKKIRTQTRDEAVKDFLNIPSGTIHPRELASECEYLMTKLCKAQSAAGMSGAMDLLLRLLKEKRHVGMTEQLLDDDDNGTELPNRPRQMIVTDGLFHIIMFGWAKLSSKISEEGPRRINELLDLMIQENDYDQQQKQADDDDGERDGRMISCQPSTKSYNILLTALANASRNDPKKSPKHAESTLQTMSDHHSQRGWHTKPNSRSWSLVIKAYADSKTFEAGRNAERVLNRMKDVHRQELVRYEEDGGDGSDGNASYYDMEDESNNVRKIVTPDAVAHTTVILAYANCDSKGSAEQAERVLLEILQSGGNASTTGDDRYGLRLKPDAIAFTSTIHAWAQAVKKINKPKARFEAAERAERILHMMKELAVQWDEDDENRMHERNNTEEADTFQEDEDEPMNQTNRRELKQIDVNPFLPTVETYNAVLNAWAQSDCRDAVPRAEQLLHQMLDESQPDRSSFHTLMNAWARFGKYDPNSAQKAEELISIMYEMYHSRKYGDSIKPTAQTYSIAMNAWAKSKERGVGGENNDDARTSNSDSKVANARRLLDTMLGKYEAGDKDMKPNIFAYTSVLSAAAYSLPNPFATKDDDDTNNDAFKIALRTFNEMKEDANNLQLVPDHFIYAIMLKVVQSHTEQNSDERRFFVESIFDDACENGQVSSLVIRDLREACPGVDVFERLVGRKKSSPNQALLSRSWTKNVHGSKRIHNVELQRGSSTSRNSPVSRRAGSVRRKRAIT